MNAYMSVMTAAFFTVLVLGLLLALVVAGVEAYRYLRK